MEKTFLNDVEFLARILITFSTLLFVAAVIFVIVTTFAKSKRITFNKRIFVFTVSIAASIWCLQFLADYVNTDCPAQTWFELIVFSFYHTLKSFGAEDSFLMGIQDMLSLIPTDKFFEYRLLCSVLAFCAPVTSATIFFEILSNFFPKIKLYLYSICFFKKKYFFSKLNEQSIALAKSILDTEKGLSPIIIFSDVYENRTEENTSELFAKAKEINAICLRDDIVHIHKKGLGKKKYFLIDENEIANLQAFVKLTDEPNYKSLKKSEVYLFCQNYIYTDVEKQARKKVMKNNGSAEDFVVIPVRSYRNLITNMLEKTPLYEPIVHQRKNNPDTELNLNITIIGIGEIGTEMFLTTYWMGQMLNCKLNINVVSKESEKDFWGKIDYINPEIRRTVYVETKDKTEGKDNTDELLRIYNKGRKDQNGNIIPDESNFAKPYAHVNYISCDVESEDFRQLLEGENGCTRLLDTHYALISLGSDQANLLAANTLKNRISKYRIEHIAIDDKNKNDNKTIINYVVYNEALSETLNTDKFVCSYDKINPDIYMQAVGGIKQVFRAENIFMSDYNEAGEASAQDYEKKQAEAYAGRKKSEYEYWSNLALRLHFKYKVFSANLIGSSIFDNETEYTKNTNTAFDTYIKLARRELKETYSFEQEMKFQNSMQWLEHRRWCAFLRTMGYRYTNDYKNYLEMTQSHKQMDVKLHPCLVECDKLGIHGTLDSQGYVENSLVEVTTTGAEEEKRTVVIINATEEEVLNFDLLDKFTYDLAKLKQQDCEKENHDLAYLSVYDFKKYDYPNNPYLKTIKINKEG